ncbi:MAG: hypothetical protein ACXVLT_07665 [Flavisolibacter sp.]
MDKVQKTHKLSDAEFWSALRANGGLYAKTARYIKSKYKVPYTRQAVKSRALSRPEDLEDIIEETSDVAEECLFTLIRTGQPSIRLAAIKIFLEAKGRDRGYGKGGGEVRTTTASNELPRMTILWEI